MNIYVGRVASSVKEGELRREFEKYGEVSNVRLAKGFAFVEMPDETKAQTAIKLLEGKELNGRKISVKESQPVSDDMPAWRRFLRALAGGGV